jgi:outer membrane protein
MNSFTKILVLSLLAASLSPPHAHAVPKPNSPSKSTDMSAATQQAAAQEGQTPPQVILSMKAAIAMAVSRNIDLRIESQNSRMASVDSIKSRGIYNPVLNASSTGGISAVPGEAFFSTKNLTSSIGLIQNLPTGGNVSATTQTGYFRYSPSTTASKEWQSTAGLTLTQPLLRNAGIETFEMNITLAATTLQDSLERFRSTTSDTVSNVITSYNRLYVLRQVRETREAALLSAQTLLDGIRKNEPGVAQGLGIADAEFAIAQRRKDFVEASRSVADQEINLRYLIGLENPLHIIPSDPPSREEPQETDEQAVKAALEFRSDLRQLNTGLQSAQLQERVARHQSRPDLSINAGGGFTGTGYNFGESYRQIGNNPGTFWSAGLQFSVPLGNTTAHNEYIRNKIRAEQAQDQIRALAWKIRNDVETDMRALISARMQMQLTEKSSQLAEQRLEQYRQNNKLKLASVQDVLNAENDLNIARNSQLEAVETFSNAVTKLWKDTGLLLDRQGIRVETSRSEGTASSGVQGPSLTVDPLAVSVQTPGTVAEREQAPDSPPPPTAPAIAATATPPVTGTQAGAPAKSKTYTLTVGEYSSKSTMADAVEKIESVGLVPQVQQGPQRTEQMTRLYLGEFPNQSLAQKALKKLQLFKANGFIQLNDKKQHVVYAGSFLDQNSAQKEQARLAGHGIKVRPEKTSVSLTTFYLTAGNFLGREVAVKYARKLEQLGLKPVVTEKP